jgi:hypothetical protein
MGGNGGDRQKPGVFRMAQSFLQEACSFLESHVRRVLSSIADRWCVVSSHPRIVIFVCERVEDEIRPVEASDGWVCEVVHRMRIVQLTTVVSIVSQILHPGGEMIFMIALLHNLGIAA